MTYDEPAKIMFDLPLDNQVIVMAALLSNTVIAEELGRTQWFLRWVKQFPPLLGIALNVAEGIKVNGWEKP